MTAADRRIITLLAPAMMALLPVAPPLARPAHGKPPETPILKDVGFDQKLDAQVPLELGFTDETGTPVKLRDYFGDKPVVLVLAYYQCPRLCNLVLNGLVQGMLEMSLSPGKEFNVVTVSFDPRESWRLAAEKKRSYLRRYSRPDAENGWHFLTGDEPEIKRLADSVGFRYKYDPRRDQYVHAAGIMILTPQGKVSRYFYDVNYSGRDLRLGLVEASHNRIGSPVDQILLYCFHYDPSVGKYSASVLAFVRIGGVLTLLAIGGLFWFLSRGRPAEDGDQRAESEDAGEPQDSRETEIAIDSGRQSAVAAVGAAAPTASQESGENS